VLGVKIQTFSRWHRHWISWKAELLAVQLVEFSAVLEFFTNAPADLDAMVHGTHRDVASIEECMQVTSEK
jgi:hypothetical protein